MCPETSLLRLLCPLQAKCIKTGPGSHSCQCLTGWREDGDDCQPINNCDGPDRGGCHPNATCIYVGPGQVTAITPCNMLSALSVWFLCLFIIKLGVVRISWATVPSRVLLFLWFWSLLNQQSDCTCKPGYKGNGRDCEAVNQCVTANGGCHYFVSRLIFFLTVTREADRLMIY